MNNNQFLKLKQAVESRGENALNSVFQSFGKETNLSPSVVSNAYYSIRKTEYWKNLGITPNAETVYHYEVPVETGRKKVKITVEL